MVKASTIRVILSIAVTKGWKLHQLDFNNAFLNGKLDEDVYMSQPSGYVDQRFPRYVCKLNKAIYGLKQAPRAWNNTLRSTLISWGFVNARFDTSLFIYLNAKDIVLLLVYVDDVVVTGNNSLLIDRFIKSLDGRFALKDLGTLSYFLGIQVHYLPNGILLNQKKYVDDLLYKLQIDDLKSARSSTVFSQKLSLHDGTPLENPLTYCSVIGALQYLTHTRPDIAFIVNQLSQFLKAPTDNHWQALKRVLRYVSGTRDYGIYIQQSDDLNISAYSDVDWASNLDDRKSVAAYCSFIGNNLVSWASKKQCAVARSSTESEYRALALASTDCVATAIKD